MFRILHAEYVAKDHKSRKIFEEYRATFLKSCRLLSPPQTSARKAFLFGVYNN